MRVVDVSYSAAARVTGAPGNARVLSRKPRSRLRRTQKVRRLARIAMMLVTSVAAVGAYAAEAQKYPERPLRLLVPYAPGGSVDIIGRIIAQKLTDSLGQQVVVDNRPGGGATIATGLLARARPDGYTLLLADIAFGASPALVAKLAYDPIRDFQPVTLVAVLPSILVVDTTLGVTSVSEFVALAKSRPGKLNYSSAGIGSMNFLAAELFKSDTGIDVVHVPYQSGGQAITAILGGQTQMVITTIPPVLQHVKAGKVRGLAVAGSKRQPSLPEVPTFGEAGFGGFDVSLWQGILVPAGTPQEVVSRLNSEVNRMLAQPDVRARLADLGAEPAGGSPQQFAAFIKTEITRWTKLIKPEMRAN
jgi:tripartite-type tricarboxylate transporter receptor subunit TctC